MSDTDLREVMRALGKIEGILETQVKDQAITLKTHGERIGALEHFKVHIRAIWGVIAATGGFVLMKLPLAELITGALK